MTFLTKVPYKEAATILRKLFGRLYSWEEIIGGARAYIAAD